MGCDSTHCFDFGDADNADCIDHRFYGSWLLHTLRNHHFLGELTELHITLTSNRYIAMATLIATFL